MPDPKIGDEIYLDTELYLSHGRDDFRGGLAKVIEIKADISAGKRCTFIRCEEEPDTWHNWTTYLEPMQERLRKEFGTRRAHPDPDWRPEFNE